MVDVTPPPPVMEEEPVDDFVADSDDNVDNYSYFLTKVLTNVMSAETLRAKILEKSSADECKVQLRILDLVKELNALLIVKKPVELFKDQTCIVLYNEILDCQASQHFTVSGWKVVAFATLVPMLNRIFIYTSGVFHTRRVPIFFSWKVNSQKGHSDMKVNPSEMPGNIVEQHLTPSLVEKPTPTSENFADWFNQSSLESFDRSDREHNDSIDSGKTVQGPSFQPQNPSIPVMNAKDISMIDSVETTQDSYLDISFINPKRRLNLSKQDKLDILEGPSSTHSTPIRITDPRRPKLGLAMKKCGKQPQGQTNFLTQKIIQWFQSQLGVITAEIQHEIEVSAINMQN